MHGWVVGIFRAPLYARPSSEIVSPGMVFFSPPRLFHRPELIRAVQHAAGAQKTMVNLLKLRVIEQMIQDQRIYAKFISSVHIGQRRAPSVASETLHRPRIISVHSGQDKVFAASKALRACFEFSSTHSNILGTLVDGAVFLDATFTAGLKKLGISPSAEFTSYTSRSLRKAIFFHLSRA